MLGRWVLLMSWHPLIRLRVRAGARRGAGTLGDMGTHTRPALALRETIDARRPELDALLAKYAATNPRLFGSVARGDASEESDIDILVEMDPADGNLLMRASGLMEETRQLYGRDDIDIFPVQLLKAPVSESALSDAVAL